MNYITLEEINTEIMHHFIFVLSQEIILKELNVYWDNIAGLEECKSAIKDAIVYPLKYPIFFKGPFAPCKSILLYGPPGTGKILVFLSFPYMFTSNYEIGKTMLAKAVATECQCTFFNVTTSSLVDKWRGDSKKYIRVSWFPLSMKKRF